MSLINEALKKAQRARVDDPASADASSPPGSGPVARRGRARSTNTMVLIGAGAFVLVVLSVVVTVLLLNRSDSTPTPVAATAPTTPPAATSATVTETPSPSVASTEIKPAVPPPIVAAPAPATEIKPAATPTTPAPAIAAASVPPSSLANAPAVADPSAAAPAATTTAPSNAKPDERIAAYIDSIRVTATRSAEGRVLMNDRVYRVNDIVERNLGVRLIKVAVDSLTFSDANGATYVKYF